MSSSNGARGKILIGKNLNLVKWILQKIGCWQLHQVWTVKRSHYRLCILGFLFKATQERFPFGSHQPVIDKIQKKLDRRRHFNPSRGRLTLNKAVLSNLPIDYMSSFTMPSKVLAEIEKIMQDFFVKINHLVKWVGFQTANTRRSQFWWDKKQKHGIIGKMGLKIYSWRESSLIQSSKEYPWEWLLRLAHVWKSWKNPSKPLDQPLSNFVKSWILCLLQSRPRC